MTSAAAAAALSSVESADSARVAEGASAEGAIVVEGTAAKPLIITVVNKKIGNWLNVNDAAFSD